jgi:DUF4097 and DUF4098 domain-containing protein YvlB
MLRKSLFFLVLSLLLAGVPALSRAQSTSPSQVVNRAFSQGGFIQMHLQAGDYQIRRSTEDKIHVEWTARSSKVDRVKVDLTSSAGKADLTVETPDNGDVHVIIEVPATTNLFIRLTAGDLNVEGIAGDKNIESRAGDMNIDVVDPTSYGTVDASVTLGDLTAEAFNVSKGGIHNTLRLNGSGRYTLHAHVDAGDLRLYGKKKEPI